jgi:maltoporin
MPRPGRAAAALVLLLAAARVPAVELHGYLRSGIGGSSGGGGQVCFGQGTALEAASGYELRLGNECETYAEVELRETLFRDKSGVEFTYVGMVSYFTAQRAGYESLTAPAPPADPATEAPFRDPATGAPLARASDLAFRQSWVGAALPQLGGALLWAGKRYYHRQELHQGELYYWDASGYGAGVENVLLGRSKLAVAIFAERRDDAVVVWRPDVRLLAIPVGVGVLDAGVSLYVTSDRGGALPAGAQRVSPFVTVQHLWPDLLGGSNRLAIQLATGSAAPMTPAPAYGNPARARQWRIVEQLAFEPTDRLSGMLALTYADLTRRTGGTGTADSARVLGAALRPAVHLHELFKVQGEVGVQQLRPKSGPDRAPRTLVKATLAPTVNPVPGPAGAFLTRPELRVFVTWAAWSRAMQREDLAGQGTCATTGVSAGPFGCATRGLTFGAQVEAAW